MPPEAADGIGGISQVNKYLYKIISSLFSMVSS